MGLVEVATGYWARRRTLADLGPMPPDGLLARLRFDPAVLEPPERGGDRAPVCVAAAMARSARIGIDEPENHYLSGSTGGSGLQNGFAGA